MPRHVTALLIMDRYALFYMGVIIASAVVVAVLSYPYFEKQEGHREELYVLLSIATLGCTVLVASSHLMSFFLGLEILSVSLYAMIAYLKERKQSLEAGIKYLVLAAASSAFLLFGMALVYADLGTMEFSRIAAASAATSHLALQLPGIVLIITGIGFKLAVVPFHLWTPDVYEGAPAPVTAFIATVSKTADLCAAVALLLRPRRATVSRVIRRVRDHRGGLDDCRQSAGAAANQCEAYSRLFVHRAFRLHAGGGCGRWNA